MGRLRGVPLPSISVKFWGPIAASVTSDIFCVTSDTSTSQPTSPLYRPQSELQCDTLGVRIGHHGQELWRFECSVARFSYLPHAGRGIFSDSTIVLTCDRSCKRGIFILLYGRFDVRNPAQCSMLTPVDYSGSFKSSHLASQSSN